MGPHTRTAFFFGPRDRLSEVKTRVVDDLKDTIKQNAEGPESAEVDGVRVKQHGLRDQIEADKYLAGKDARRNPARAFARVKIVPPGTV